MRLIILFVFALLATSPATAGLFSNTGLPDSPFASSQKIPPVDVAMPLAVEQSSAGIKLQFDLISNVYLYRPQLKLTPLDAKGDKLAFVTPPVIPEGKAHQDEVYGNTEVYFGQLIVQVPEASFPANAASLLVQYQGCMQDVLCYPPQRHTIKLAFTPDSSHSAIPKSAPQENATPDAEQSVFSVLKSADAGRFVSWAQQQSLGMILLLFFVGGLLMAFTPCVFPMFPILLSILAGTKKPGPVRGFLVSLAYVIGMAIPYTLLGLVVALSGAQLHLRYWLQQPAAVLIAAVIFIALALSMFGLYALQMPASWRDKAGSGQGGSFWKAGVIGAISGLVVSPCITPVLAGALLFVAVQGQAVTGTLALFSLTLGMGVPLLIIGAGGASLLPRAGSFMDDIKHFFGLVLMLMAAWLIGRVIGPSLVLWLYGGILLVYGVTLGAFDITRKFRQAVALLIVVIGVLLMVGAASGSKSVFTPLAGLTTANTISQTSAQTQSSAFQDVDGADLSAQLAQAAREDKPVLVDFYADWCTACKELDATTLSNPVVLDAMKGLTLIRVDITDINKTNRQLMQQYHILGLPTLVFFDREGQEIPRARVLGYMDSKQWLAHFDKRVIPAI